MASEPQTFTTDEHVRRVVDMLLRREGRRHRHLAEMLGTTRQTATNKLKGASRFRIDELEVLARTFKVDVAVFFDPARAIPTAPVLPPVPDPGRDLLTCTKYQAALVSTKGRAHYGIAAKEPLIAVATAA